MSKAKEAVCLFVCDGVTDHGTSSKTVLLAARYDRSLPHDRTFNQATPWGEMKFGLQNPQLDGFFKPGKKYLIRIEEYVAEEPKPTP